MRSTREVMLKLREVRKKRGIKMEQLAQELNVAVKTAYGWENGQANPSLDVFVRICRFYGIKDIMALFDGRDAKTDEETERRALWDAYNAHPDMKQAVDILLDRKCRK